MSSKLQLDVRNLSLEMRHLVNVYEVKAGIGVIACVIHAWAPCVYYKNERYYVYPLYKYTYLFTFTFYYKLSPRSLQQTSCYSFSISLRAEGWDGMS